MNMDMFELMTDDDEADLKQQFSREMIRTLETSKATDVYRIFGISRESGRKYQRGDIPTRSSKELRKVLLNAVLNLKFNLTYRGTPLTVELLTGEEFKQLDLFRHDGFEFEINRKKTAHRISLELLIREA